LGPAAPKMVSAATFGGAGGGLFSGVGNEGGHDAASAVFSLRQTSVLIGSEPGSNL
jgi:hypothetical protein